MDTRLRGYDDLVRVRQSGELVFYTKSRYVFGPIFITTFQLKGYERVKFIKSLDKDLTSHCQWIKL
jgi:hypothetical protein